MRFGRWSGRGRAGLQLALRTPRDRAMNDPSHARRLPRPTELEIEAMVREAQRVFRATLSCWACDLLTFQRAGMTLPSWRPARNAARLARAA
jgi:hypothetical protein